MNRVTPPPGYLSPRTHPELADIQENIYCDPAETSSDDDDNIYKVPRSSIDQSPQSNGLTSGSVLRRGSSDGGRSSGGVLRRGSSDGRGSSGGVLRRGSSDGGVSGGGGYKEVRRTSSSTSNPATKRLSGHSQRSTRSSSKSVSPAPPGVDECDNGSDEAIYANDAEMNIQTPIKKPALAPKPPKPPTKPKPKAGIVEEDMYVPMEAAPRSNEQSTPQKRGSFGSADLSKQSSKSSLAFNKPSAPTKTMNASIRTTQISDPVVPNHTSCDYEDLDALDPPQRPLIPALDDYVDMSGVDPVEDLKRGDEAAARPPKSKTDGTHTIYSSLICELIKCLNFGHTYCYSSANRSLLLTIVNPLVSSPAPS